MATLEQGSGILVSVDTVNKKMKVRETKSFYVAGSPPPKEWEICYTLSWKDEEFFDLVGKRVEWVLSDGVVVRLTLNKT